MFKGVVKIRNIKLSVFDGCCFHPTASQNAKCTWLQELLCWNLQGKIRLRSAHVTPTEPQNKRVTATSSKGSVVVLVLPNRSSRPIQKAGLKSASFTSFHDAARHTWIETQKYTFTHTHDEALQIVQAVVEHCIHFLLQPAERWNGDLLKHTH